MCKHRLLLLTSLALLSAQAPSQTWVREIQGSALTDTPVTVHGSGFGTAFQLGGHFANIDFDPRGDIQRKVRLLGYEGNLSMGVALRRGSDDLLLLGSQDYRAWVSSVNPSTGSTRWDHTLSDSESWLAAGCFNALGQLVVGGSIRVAGVSGTRPFLCALSETGVVLWRRTYGNLIESEYVRHVTPLVGGGMAMLTAVRPANALTTGMRIVWLDDAGEVLAVKHLSSGYGGLIAPALIPAEDGGVVVAGALHAINPLQDFFAVRFTPSRGIMWQRSYDTFGSTFGHIRPVQTGLAHPDGGFALGVTQSIPTGPLSPDQYDMAVLRLDDQGFPVWFRAYGDAAVDESLTGLALTPEGGFLVAGGNFYGATIRLHRTRSDGTMDNCGFSSLQPTTLGGIVSFQSSTMGYVSEGPSSIDYHTLSLSYFPTSQQLCGTTCEAVGAAFGAGLAGAGGAVPTMTAVDGACLGWTPELRVTNGLGGGVGVLGLSTSSAQSPLLGGTFYLNPGAFVTMTLQLNGSPGVARAGQFVLPLNIDWTSLVGTTLYAQAFLLDPAATSGVSMTNAASLTIQ